MTGDGLFLLNGARGLITAHTNGPVLRRPDRSSIHASEMYVVYDYHYIITCSSLPQAFKTEFRQLVRSRIGTIVDRRTAPPALSPMRHNADESQSCFTVSRFSVRVAMPYGRHGAFGVSLWVTSSAAGREKVQATVSMPIKSRTGVCLYGGSASTLCLTNSTFRWPVRLSAIRPLRPGRLPRPSTSQC